MTKSSSSDDRLSGHHMTPSVPPSHVPEMDVGECAKREKVRAPAGDMWASFG